MLMDKPRGIRHPIRTLKADSSMSRRPKIESWLGRQA